LLPIVAGVSVLLAGPACNRRSDPRPDPAAKPSSAEPPALAPGLSTADADAVITAELLRTHTRALADDAMEGRRPGTPGARRAVEYIVTAMRDLGLEPAGDDGKFTQRVPMRSVRTLSTGTALGVATKRARVELTFGDRFVGGSFAEAGTHAIDAPLLFAGYGVTAPEFGWDDYEGVDAAGKVVVVFVGDPPTGDDRFGGDAMTYYGRWSYKFERAREAGALGCLVVHEDEPASYGWNVVQGSWSGDRFEIADATPSGTPLALEGWISADTAEAIAGLTGASLARWHTRALEPGFRATPLAATLTGTLATQDTTVSDDNVVGKIRGQSRADEAVYVLAHWDHLGIAGDADPGQDRIFNGAVDNASGVAGLLAVAAGLQARVKAGQRPARSVVFVATTAEEQGLLGSRYQAAHPAVPIGDIAAVINLDSMNVGDRTRTVEIVGAGHSSLDEILAEVVATQGRTLVHESRASAGGFYRSDHFPFALLGVPALYFHGGIELEAGGVAAGKAWAEERARRYHTVDDDYDPQWSFAGAEQDARAVLGVVVRVADAPDPPQWKPSSEFASRRP
jgi:Zn-dependent M28 family amino/carboxypeptidase